MRTSKRLYLVVYLFVIGVFCVSSPTLAADGILKIEFHLRDGSFEAVAVEGKRRSKTVLDEDGAALMKRMRKLYTMLESSSDRPAGELSEALQEAGDELLAPFQEAIDRADTVAIGISPAMTRIPFEHLFLHGQPLGLQKPIFVFLEECPAEALKWSDIRTALVLADLTADPEKGCEAAATTMGKKLDRVAYHDIDDLEPAFLKRLKPHDLLLVSAHGDVSFSEDDCIEHDERSYYPETWAKCAPKLAYFDSCQVGASKRFLEAFQEAGTRYLLAPIVSNEAGNSSTKTIRFFFESLMAGESPEKAMFTARTSLQQTFSRNGKTPLGKMLYRVLPFRVYRLN